MGRGVAQDRMPLSCDAVDQTRCARYLYSPEGEVLRTWELGGVLVDAEVLVRGRWSGDRLIEADWVPLSSAQLRAGA